MGLITIFNRKWKIDRGAARRARRRAIRSAASNGQRPRRAGLRYAPAIVRRLPPIVIALAALSPGWSGCSDDNVQECVPGEDERCPDQTCAVDRAGTPLCVEPGAAEEGALCRQADDPSAVEASVRCGVGLGCLRVAGVSRCLRFCDPTLDFDTCAPEGNRRITPGAGPELLRAYARCVGVLPDRPEVGVCVLPCRPDRSDTCEGDEDVCAAFPDDCPTATTCGLNPQAPMPLCVPEGAGVEGAPCDAEAGCAAGLLCTRIDGVSRCRLATDARDGCPAGYRSAPVPGVIDPLVVMTVRLESVCLPREAAD